MKHSGIGQEYHWPRLCYHKQPYEGTHLDVVVLIKSCKFTVKPLALPFEIVEYLLIVCDQLKLSISSMQLTLSVASRYLRSKRNNLPLQLIIMTCLMICSKFV